MAKKKAAECYEFYVDGMHCAACELTIERHLKKFKGVTEVDAKLDDGIVTVKGNFDENPEDLAKDFTKLVKKDGYEIYTENIGNALKVNWKDFVYALPIAIIFVLIFLILQWSGILSTDVDAKTSLIAVFIIGIVASLSSCAAVVGGLVLSVSANFAKQSSPTSNLRAQISFHIGRLFGFFILGGLLGLLGGLIPIEWVVSIILGFVLAYFADSLLSRKISNTISRSILTLTIFTILGSVLFHFLIIIISNVSMIESIYIARFALTLIVVTVMIILGLNLLEIFAFTRHLQFKMPKALSKSVLKAENLNSWFGPVLLGALTFFLPCGITQTMQTIALETRSFVDGSLTMFVFALGTLPVLAIISFASVNLGEKVRSSGVFFKTAGLLVIAFAIYNLIGALATIGFVF